MADTNIDRFRIGGNMKDEENIVDSSLVASSDKGSAASKDQQLSSPGNSSNVGGVGGGNPSKECVTNNNRVTKKASKKKKNACYLSKCSNPASKFIGDCNFCKGHFCSKHRLMENHACEGLTSCKEVMHKRNADKLAAEQTRAPKIQI